MKTLCLLVVLVLAPPVNAGVEHRTLHDAARGRDVPVKITTPGDDEGSGLRPTVFFSHGLGGSVEAAGYLAEGLAERGYVVVNVQHPGSDEPVWRDVPRWRRMSALKAAMTAEQAAARPLDVSFALTALLEGGEVPIDPERVGVAGHSFGAYTVMALAGRRFPRGSFGDDRFRAAVHISGQAVDDPTDFAGVRIPILHVTGTLDDSPVQPDLRPLDRRDAYDAIGAPGQFLVTFDGADHAVFSSANARRGEQRDPAHDAAVQQAVIRACGEFLDAYLAVPAGELDPAALRGAVRPADAVESK